MQKEKTAVMYGAGKIGRGFIGHLLYQSGYRIAFVDIKEDLVEALNSRGAYPLRLMQGDASTDGIVDNLIAVDGRDMEQTAEAIAGADLVATAVGANQLPSIAPFIARGLALRQGRGGAPLDILICENLKDAGPTLRGLILAHLPEESHGWFEACVGLVETSIGCIVPQQTPELQDGDPIRICGEAYDTLPADQEAFRAGIPAVRGLVPYAPFSFYVERKLYICNMSHALTAYCGDYLGLTTICQAIGEPDVREIVRAAMLSSADAIARRFQADASELNAYADELLVRYSNRRLDDTVSRVGFDVRRKLAAKDRMMGALRACLEEGTDGSRVALGIALALRFTHDSLPMPAERALTEICGIGEKEPVYAQILSMHERARAGVKLAELIE